MRLILVLITSLLLAPALAYAVEIPISRDEISLSFSPVVKRVVPAVVNIYTRHVEKVANVSPFMNDPLFSQFFGEQGFGGLPHERVVQSLGSGVIIGADGTIVTSYHVVKGSEQITVALSDKREFEGHVEKVDERSDLAILKVNTKGEILPALELKDSDTLEVGDLVLAVGNPFGVGQTVTSGIISALARSASDISDYQFFIQTDAAINPGNSGGALVDMQGKLIGINTAIYTHSGGYQGIGFAIPSNMVAAVMKSRASKAGNVIRPWFGVSVQPVTREIADAAGLPLRKGVLVKDVAAQSPAQKAGIKPGDIITSLGSGEVNDSQSLNFRIATTGIGTTTMVNIWRDGKEIKTPVSFTVPPAELPNQKTVLLKGKHPLNGATVALLTPDMAEELHLKPDSQGVVVIHGTQDAAFGMNIQAGDIVLAVNGKEISTIADLENVLSVNTHKFQISLLRGGAVFTMTVVR
jgi:serine protease Do